VLRELVSKTNVYINKRGKHLSVALVEYIARWVGQMLRMFGLGEGEKEDLGWGQADQGSENVNVRFLVISNLMRFSYKNQSSGRKF
jgi:cysteinyl-tRNA synthetase